MDSISNPNIDIFLIPSYIMAPFPKIKCQYKVVENIEELGKNS